MKRLVKRCLDISQLYFDLIDKQMARRLLRSISSYETTLSDEFLALLDGNTRDREDEKRPWSKFKKDLAQELATARDRNPSTQILADLDIAFTAHDHSRRFEGTVSKADIGLVIQAGDPKASQDLRSASYLLQAKRLQSDHVTRDRSYYSLRSGFSSLDTNQAEEIRSIQLHVAANSFRYLYYMPRRCEIYEASDAASSDPLARSGLWIGNIVASDRITAADIYDRHRLTTLPFSAAILGHILDALGQAQAASALTGGLLAPLLIEEEMSDKQRLALGIAKGDQDAARQLLAKLGKSSAESFRVLPRASINIVLPSAPRPEPRFSTGPGPSG